MPVKRISVAILLLLIAAACACAQPPAVVTPPCSAQAGGATAATCSLSVTSGNAVYIVIAVNGNGSSCTGTMTVGDGGANTYTKISTSQAQTFNCSARYYVCNATGGTLTFSANDSASQAKAVTVVQITGAAASSCLDASASVQKSCTSGTSCTSASFSTSGANELVIAAAGDFQAGAWTAGNIGGSAASIPTSGSQNNANGSMSTAIESLGFTAQKTSITAAIGKASVTQLALFVDAFVSSGGGGGGGCTLPSLDLLGVGCE